MFEKKITFDSFIRGVLVALMIAGALFMLNYLSGVLLPFFIAWLLAYLLYPSVTFVQYKMHFKSRALSIFTILLALIGIVTLAGLLLVPPFIADCIKLEALMKAYFVEGSKQAAIPTAIAEFLNNHIDMEVILNSLNHDIFLDLIRKGLPHAWNLITHSFNFVVGIFTVFIILLYMVFILLDYESIAEGTIRIVPNRRKGPIKKVLKDVEHGMSSYFRGQALVALCVGVLFSIGFLIIDFPLAIGFGLFIGLLNMVPYLQLVALIPTVLLALLKAADTGQNFWWILFLAILVFCVVQAIQDTIIVPKIMGKITGMHPAVILLSLSVWGALLGMLGMIIALPATTLLISYYKTYVLGRIDQKGEKLPE